MRILTASLLAMVGFACSASGQDHKVCNPCQFRISQKVAEDHLIRRVEPEYPADLRSTGLSGQIVVRLVIDEQGKAEGVAAVSDESIQTSADPRMIEAAVKAVQQWTFNPYLLNGKPIEVETIVRLPYNFSPQKASPTDTPQAAPSPSPAETPQVQPRPTKLRVSQGVAEQNLIHKVQPVYPLEALQKGISGDVFLGATISGTGDVENLHVISGDPILAQASLDAVKKWKYRPYTLKGEPVKVETTVRISFHLSGS